VCVCVCVCACACACMHTCVCMHLWCVYHTVCKRKVQVCQNTHTHAHRELKICTYLSALMSFFAESGTALMPNFWARAFSLWKQQHISSGQKSLIILSWITVQGRTVMLSMLTFHTRHAGYDCVNKNKSRKHSLDSLLKQEIKKIKKSRWIGNAKLKKSMWLWQMVTFTVTHTNVKKQMQVNYHHTEFQTACIKKNQTAQKPKQKPPSTDQSSHWDSKCVNYNKITCITLYLTVSSSLMQQYHAHDYNNKLSYRWNT